MADLFIEHDRFGLSRLSPGDRDRQLNARAELVAYLGQLDARLKAEHGWDPKYDPELAVLGAYRHLAGALADTIMAVLGEAGDDQRRDASSPTPATGPTYRCRRAPVSKTGRWGGRASKQSAKPPVRSHRRSGSSTTL